MRRGRRLGVLDELDRLQGDVVDPQRRADHVQRQRPGGAVRTQRQVLGLDEQDGAEEGAVADHAGLPAHRATAEVGLGRVGAGAQRGFEFQGGRERRVGAGRREVGAGPLAPGLERRAHPQGLGEGAAAQRHQCQCDQGEGDRAEAGGDRPADRPADRDQGHRDLDQHELLEPQPTAEQPGPGVDADRDGPLGSVGAARGGGACGVGPFAPRGAALTAAP